MTDWWSVSVVVAAGIIISVFLIFRMTRRNKPAPERKPDTSAAIKGFAWGAGSVALIAVGAWYAVKAAHPQPAAMAAEARQEMAAPAVLDAAVAETAVPQTVSSPHAALKLQSMTSSAADDAVHITLNADAKATYAPNAVIWVTVRPAGAAKGPHIAVKKVPVGLFPITFDISSADSMMGQPIPQSMRIEARVDSDGDPMTKEPNSPSAFADPVNVAANITLQLK